MGAGGCSGPLLLPMLRLDRLLQLELGSYMLLHGLTAVPSACLPPAPLPPLPTCLPRAAAAPAACRRAEGAAFSDSSAASLADFLREAIVL